jgi:hypothetical protein
LTHPKVTAAWRAVWEALNARQSQTKADIVAQNLFRNDTNLPAGVSRIASASLQTLINSARRLDPDTAAPALTALIGLGAGLTPSGDDLLVGFLAGLWCSVGEDAERLAFLAKLGEAVIALSTRTNDISRTYLLHAARGKVSSRLLALAEALSRGEESARLLAAAEAAMQTGHTSGMDAVTGLLAGMTAWDTRPLPKQR